MCRRSTRGPIVATTTEEVMVDWRGQVEQLGPIAGGHDPALHRIDALLAGEDVEDVVMVVRRDVCDEGHLHADVSVWMLTATRLLSTEVNDARHLHAPTPHDGTSVHTVQVPLRAVDDVVLNSWVGEDGDPVALISVSHRSGRGGGTVAQHVCDDPDCPEGDGTFLLESWDEGLEIVANGDDAATFVRFAGALGVAAASR
jgi:hypothetical protein